MQVLRTLRSPHGGAWAQPGTIYPMEGSGNWNHFPDRIFNSTPFLILHRERKMPAQGHPLPKLPHHQVLPWHLLREHPTAKGRKHLAQHCQK